MTRTQNNQKGETEMLKEGDIFEMKQGNCFYVKKFPKAFLCDNGDFDFSPHTGEIWIDGLRRGLDTSIFIGRYIVVKTTVEGGGHQLEMGSANNWSEMPDGHRVWAKKIVKSMFSGKSVVSKFEISFYQSGHFTCMNPDIEAISAGKIEYVIEEN
jgi:hypothetical protein